jgi:hypothetical protein
MKPLLSLIFLIGFSNQIVSQTYYEGDYKKMDPSKIEKWNVKDKSEYQGIFHFGFSEGESTFILIISEDSCYARNQHAWFLPIFCPYGTFECCSSQFVIGRQHIPP